MQIKKLREIAKVPTRGSEEAAGYDLYACIEDGEGVEIPPHQTVKIGTGIAIALPKGTFGGIYARSGLATKEGLRPANAVGIADSDYRGELIVALHNDSTEFRYVKSGDRIAQLIVQPYISVDMEVVDELDETKRGDGGFGSSGR